MTDPTLIFYELLSWLTLPAERQLAFLTSVPPTRDIARENHRDNNVLIWINRAVLEYYQFWYDEFAPSDKHAKDLVELMEEFGRIASIEPPGPFCLESLLQGDEWQRARKLALSAIEECGLDGPLDLTEPLFIEEMIETYDFQDNCGDR